MSTSAPMESGIRLVVQYKVEEAERKFHERVLLHHVVDDEYFVLTPDNDRYNESLGEYSSYDRLHGRDRYPHPVQREVHAFVEPIADDEKGHMVVDARAACAARQDEFLRLSLPGDRRCFPLAFCFCVLAAGPPRWRVLSKQLASFVGEKAGGSTTRGNEHSSLSGDASWKGVDGGGHEVWLVKLRWTHSWNRGAIDSWIVGSLSMWPLVICLLVVSVSVGWLAPLKLRSAL